MRVVVGRIGRPHGIRGEVTVETRTDEPDERFAPGAVLSVDGPVTQLVVERTHWHSGRLLVTFEGTARPQRRGGAARAAPARGARCRRDARRSGGVLRQLPRGLRGDPDRRHPGRNGRRGRPPAIAGPAVRAHPGRARCPGARSSARSCRPSMSWPGESSSTRRPGCWRTSSRDAHRRRHDLPRLRRAAPTVAGRQGDRLRHRRPARARPARLHPRPAPHGRRHPLRRGSGDGDEPTALGRGPGRPRCLRRGTAPDAGDPHAVRVAVHAGDGAGVEPARLAGLRLRPLRGHRLPGGRRTTPRATTGPAFARSRSATTCWPVGRRPCS